MKQFDSYADDYEAALGKGLTVSGEGCEYFARGRLNWLSERLRQVQFSPRTAADFGCGTGTAVPLLFELLGVDRVVGIDPSERSLDVARKRHGNGCARFVSSMVDDLDSRFDLVYCNGVFHHIKPEHRAMAMRDVLRLLPPGGLFAFFENNPWNPGTRYVMSRISFDRDAVTVSPREGRGLLLSTGFELITTDYLFFFPRLLNRLRWLERHLRGIPMGAQYLILARKPGTPARKGAV